MMCSKDSSGNIKEKIHMQISLEEGEQLLNRGSYRGIMFKVTLLIVYKNVWLISSWYYLYILPKNEQILRTFKIN